MDAATLYTIITLLNGREYIGRDEFSSVAQCEAMLKMMNNRQIGGQPTRYSCERHIRISPAKNALGRRDATTLYVIVILANGDVRTAIDFPLGSVERCQRASRDVFFRGRIVNDSLRAGAKSVMFYCAPWPKTLVIAH